MSSKKIGNDRINPETTTPVIDAKHEEVIAAYRRVEAEVDAVTEPVRILTDIPRAVTTVLGAVASIQALRPEIVDQFKHFDITVVDRLPDYALGAWYAHVTATSAEKRILPLVEEAAPLRQKLLAAAGAHAAFGDLDHARIQQITQGSGYLDTAGDLVALARLFRDAWAKIGHRTLVSEADLVRAEQLGTAIVRALSDSAAIVTAAGERRASAYTVLVNAYDECRRAVTFVRWHEDDVDEIVPSLFTKPRNRKPKASESSDDRAQPPPATPAEPAAAAAGDVAR